MKDHRQLLRQASVYLSGNVVVSLGGLISFPLWTRVLTQTDYGTLNLVNVSVYFLTSVSKAGLQKSAVRFFSEFVHGQRSEPLARYYTTHVLGAFGTSLLLNTVFVLFVKLTGIVSGEIEALGTLVTLVFVLATLDSILSVQLSFLRAEQKARQYATWAIANRYMDIAIGAVMVFALHLGVVGLIWGQVISAALAVTVLTIRLIRQGGLRLRAFSPSYFREALGYGLPMVPFESSKEVLELGDRFVIQFFMGPAAVGVYSAGYNLTMHVRQLLSLPLNRAITPMFLDLWHQRGENDTREFLETVLDYYLMVAVPIIVLFSVFSRDLILVLASDKYLESAAIVPFLAGPLVLNGANSIFGAGLVIHKKTRAMMYVALGAALLNVALNFVLVPLQGIMGAAIATLVAYLFLILVTGYLSFKLLPLRIQLRNVLVYLGAAGLMLAIYHAFDPATLVGRAVEALAGAVAYAACVIAFDRRIRRFLVDRVGSRIRREVEK